MKKIKGKETPLIFFTRLDEGQRRLKSMGQNKGGGVSHGIKMSL